MMCECTQTKRVEAGDGKLQIAAAAATTTKQEMTREKDTASLVLGPGSAAQTLMDLRASEGLVVVIVVAVCFTEKNS